MPIRINILSLIRSWQPTIMFEKSMRSIKQLSRRRIGLTSFLVFPRTI